MFDYAMDLGTSSVLLYREGKGIVLREPSVVAMRRSSGSVVGAGQKARDMLGRTPEDLLAVLGAGARTARIYRAARL